MIHVRLFQIFYYNEFKLFLLGKSRSEWRKEDPVGSYLKRSLYFNAKKNNVLHDIRKLQKLFARYLIFI